MRAKDVMRRRVFTLSPETTLREAALLFARYRITGAPVVGPRRELLGVVSQTDLVRRGLQQAAGEVPAFYRDGERIELTTVSEDPGHARVAEVMTPAVLSAEEDTPVEALARVMWRRRIHRVMITRGGKLAGIVTSLDLLRAVAPERRGARAARRHAAK